MDNNYVIDCDTLAMFIACCAGLVKEGVCFKAYAHNLTIDCTGGF